MYIIQILYVSFHSSCIYLQSAYMFIKWKIYFYFHHSVVRRFLVSSHSLRFFFILSSHLYFYFSFSVYFPALHHFSHPSISVRVYLSRSMPFPLFDNSFALSYLFIFAMLLSSLLQVFCPYGHPIGANVIQKCVNIIIGHTEMTFFVRHCLHRKGVPTISIKTNTQRRILLQSVCVYKT